MTEQEEDFPEGMLHAWKLDALGADILRSYITNGMDDELAQWGTGMTPEEAPAVLRCYELASLPIWGADELADALTVGELAGGFWGEVHEESERPMMIRRIQLAQAAGHLPKYFRATDGLKWAQQYVAFIHPELRVAVRYVAPRFDGSLEERWQAMCAAATPEFKEQTDKPMQRATQSRGSDALAHAMSAGLIAYRKLHGVVPTARALFDWLGEHDKTKTIEGIDEGAEKITWKRADGGLKDTSFKAFQNRFTNLIRKES